MQYQRLPEDQYNYNPNPYNYPYQSNNIKQLSANAYTSLMSTDSIYIKQQYDAIEAITGCEQNNVYIIYTAQITGEYVDKQNIIFKCKQESNCCLQQCCPGDSIPFEAKIIAPNPETKEEGEHSLQLIRKCTCTCCCCDRPKMQVYLVEQGKNEYLGQIIQPCKWQGCSIQLDIEDQSNQPIYKIAGQLCQGGVICPRCRCDSCKTAQFFVQDPQGTVLSNLLKKQPGCRKSMFSDVDNFALQFPAMANPQQRALLMAATIFLDFLIFEESNKCDENNLCLTICRLI